MRNKSTEQLINLIVHSTGTCRKFMLNEQFRWILSRLFLHQKWVFLIFFGTFSTVLPYYIFFSSHACWKGLFLTYSCFFFSLTLGQCSVSSVVVLTACRMELLRSQGCVNAACVQVFTIPLCCETFQVYISSNNLNLKNYDLIYLSSQKWVECWYKGLLYVFSKVFFLHQQDHPPEVLTSLYVYTTL